MWGNIVSSTSKEKQARSRFGSIDRENLGRFKGAAIGGLVLLLLASVFAYNIYIQPNAVNVIVDGSIVGTAQTQEQVEEIVQELHKEKEANGLSVNCISVIEFEPIKLTKKAIMAQEDIANILRESLVFHYGAIGISVNGEIKAILENKQLAEKVIQEVKESYLPKNGNGFEVNVLEVSTAENITFEPVDVEMEEIISFEEALELLKFGEEKVTYYEVASGDSLWTIAQKNGIRVSELEEANPDIDVSRLQIGQKLRLVKPEPAFNVQVKYEQIAQETIPFPVKNVYNDSLWRGQSQIQERGAKGKKEVTYLVTMENGRTLERNKINEVVIEEPKTQVVAVGTKLLVASRGGGGTGPLGLPLRGNITSPFGQRRGGFHSGIDINGKTGDPVYAAEAGRVIFSGWQGGYGNLVIIDHGDGVTTYYAHASQRLVSNGDQVERGDLIIRVGSTGRSTGPHLHFEVRINGRPDNPTKYLRN